MESFDMLHQTSEKRSHLLEVMGCEPQAVVLFAGAMRFDDVSGLYVSGDYSDRDENSGLISAGRDRVLAAKDIYRFFPSVLFVTTSKTRDEKKPTYASVMKRELMEFGVPESGILEESESVDTVSCVKAVMRLIDEYDWKRIVFLSAAFHAPRIEAILKRLECFAGNEDERLSLESMVSRMCEGVVRISVVASDDVLQETDPEYMRSLDAIKKSPEYKEKLAAELGGAKAILEGRKYNGYNFPPRMITKFDMEAFLRQYANMSLKPVIFLLPVALFLGGILYMAKDYWEQSDQVVAANHGSLENSTQDNSALSIVDILESYGPKYVDPKDFFVGSDDTSNWSTYRNDEFGFEVEYPRESYGDYCNKKTYDCSWVVIETDLGAMTTGMEGVHKFYFGEKGSLHNYPNGITIEVWKKDSVTNVKNPLVYKPPQQDSSVQKTDGRSTKIYSVVDQYGIVSAYASNKSNALDYKFSEDSPSQNRFRAFIQSFHLIPPS